jgi:putative hemolysin
LDLSGLESIQTWELVLVALLFVGSFYFAGTETVLTSLGAAKARQLRERLGERGRLLDLWIDHPGKVLSALLIGNNLVNVAASAVATKIALDLFDDVGLAVSTGVMTLLLLIFGEITPKTIAREHAARLAIPSLRLLRPFYFVAYPVAWALSRMAESLAAVVGAKADAGPLVSAEDVDFYIELSAKEGALGEVQEQILSSALGFADLLVKEIMIPRTSVSAVDVNSPLSDALDLAEGTGHTRLPVYDGNIDEVAGILSVKDVLPVLRRRLGHGTTAGEVRRAEEGPSANLRRYLRPAWFAPELMKVSDLLREMQRRRSHLAIVVDEFGGTSGIVTLEDVVEEIIGEVQDEHDNETPPVVRLPGGNLLVQASVPIRDLQDDLGSELPDDGDYESLGGLVVSLAGKVPVPGRRVTHAGFDFTVRSSDERRVLTVEIGPASAVSQVDLEVVDGGAGSDEADSA